MKHLKTFENLSKYKIGDYIKFKNISPWYNEPFGKSIFKIIEIENDDDLLFLKVKSIDNDKIVIFEIPTYTVRFLTTEELEEFNLKQNTNKYNL